MTARLIIADDPAGNLLFACVDPSARFVEPSVARSRFAAVLNPFPFEERAKAALMLAGGSNVREHSR